MRWAAPPPVSTTDLTSHTSSDPEGFGPNEWLVEEMYERYRVDPGSVDPAWHDFFSDYRGPAGPTESDVDPEADDPAESPAPAAASDDAPAAPATATTAEVVVDAPAPTPSAPAAAATTPASAPVVTTAPVTPAAAPVDEGRPPASPGAGAKPVAAKPAAVAKPLAGPTGGANAGAEADEAVDVSSPIRGAASKVVTNMESSLALPTATSVRAVPSKLIADNRTVINNHLRRARGGKVSFTHLIGYAMVKAVARHPEMNKHFAEVEGKPTVVQPGHVNLGLAIDLPGRNGSRNLVVAALKKSETLDFAKFVSAYEDIVRRARGGSLGIDDFSGVTISLTNPGTLGTNHSVPRLMPGQGTIIGVGAMEYPAEFSGMSPEGLAQRAISKIMTLTSTYDHRIIQGAESGAFLRTMHELLLADEFYDDIFASLRIPYEPVRWMVDRETSHEGQIDKATRVVELINAYRSNGHLMADTDPLEFTVRNHPDLDITRHGLTLWDLDREFPVGGFTGARLMSLRGILGVLRDAYCRRIGVEYMHITDPEQREWIQKRVEKVETSLPREEQKHILGRLNVAEAFETFLQTKYVGQKRFSLEGGESVIPLLDAVLGRAVQQELDEVVIGMAHRGRLNVLANIVGKPYAKIFNEFEGNIDPSTSQGSGDVKYHLGATGRFKHPNGEIDVELVANPSHLETVDPVLEGIVRAKQDVIDKGEGGFTVLPLLVHGDAAFAGQGVVAETLNLSQLRGYRTGGTVHVVINNQVGFTTSPAAARSTLYATDVARMISAPIFHVNGDDPEACVRVAKIAMDYRRDFKKDVVIDLICYRRRGHQEADNPSFTQPVMYDIIDNKRSVRKLYTEALVGRGDITLDDAEEALRDFQSQLEKVFVETRGATGRPTPTPEMPRTPDQSVSTATTPEVIKAIADAYVQVPDGFTVHPRLKPQMDRRAQMATAGNIDWATGELFAYGALLAEGRNVRLAGQDSRRGTFAQRHAVLVDRATGEEYTPLRSFSGVQGQFRVYDSLLSEYAALGFEYGYSVVDENSLVCWEAQFGDFVGGAQSIIDEYISAGEAKWGQRSSVALLLPHGYEGQGPDHSSARIERFLQLCGEKNMTVAQCTTPANWFHLLRRQGLTTVRRPLIAFTPKSLLRLKAATSPVEAFTSGGFSPVLVDSPTGDDSAVTRVVLSTGKIAYDLVAERASRAADETVAVVRVEQLYPIPVDELQAALARFPDAELVWAQEEPANQGAWPFVALAIVPHLDRTVRLVARKPSASPAVGSASVHDAQQREVVTAAFE